MLGLLKRLLTHGRNGERRLYGRYLVADRGLSQLSLEAPGGWESLGARADRAQNIAVSRYFERHSALANRLAAIYVDYTVGPRGLALVPASGYEPWDQWATTAWEEIKDQLVLGPAGQNGWAAAQALMVWRWFFDGEVFIYLTELEGRPAVQVLETHRIVQPTNLAPQQRKKIIDGIEIDPLTTQPIAYHVLTDDRGGTRRVPASQIIHIMDPSYSDQLRGMPVLTPVLRDMHCLMDLEMYEMRAHADAAEKSTIWKLHTGEFGAELVRRADLGLEQIESAGQEIADRVRHYSDALGGRAVALLPGEDVTVIQPQRPTEQQRAFWDYLINKICVGVGIPRQLVAPYSVQGTVARADLAAARSSMISASELFIRATRKIYAHALGVIMANNSGLPPAPATWSNVSIRAPRQIDVDLGRSTVAMLEELKHGASHWELIYGQMGLDWRQELRKRAEQIAYMRQLAEQFGLDMRWLSQTLVPESANSAVRARDGQEVTNGDTKD